MRVSVVRGGGIAGLVTTTTLDAADLSPPDARALRAKVDAAGVLAASSRTAPRPDRFTYELTVDADGHQHSLRVGEADLSPELSELVTWVQSAPARQQQVRPPGRTSP